MSFKPKRVTGAELTAQLAGATAHLPVAAPAAARLGPSAETSVVFPAPPFDCATVTIDPIGPFSPLAAYPRKQRSGIGA